ncbi:MAG TPA: ABC transporter ATP-binding protein [Nitriliruptorales bacterium]|nr:ABC transporter ATP-binding protein [Nitriliruptorales bacterium]
MPTSDVAIDVRGLVKRYGATVAVAGLDLPVERGETFALLGSNGAGKTTTIECCEGYRRPDAGTVRVLGLDPVRDGDRLRPRLGLMLQQGGVYPLARPPEVLALFAAFHAHPLDPEQLLEGVGLADVRRTRFRDLSGGQQQRLKLAVALVGRPELVFLDEPTAGLDPAARRRTWEVIGDLRASGVTVVLTTHLLDEAEELADRVAIIDRGELVALGSPDELTRDAGLPEVRFTAPPALDTGALSVAIDAKVEEPRPGRYVVHAAGTPGLLARLTAWLHAHDVALGDLQASRRSLEDVFLRLTRERTR